MNASDLQKGILSNIAHTITHHARIIFYFYECGEYIRAKAVKISSIFLWAGHAGCNQYFTNTTTTSTTTTTTTTTNNNNNQNQNCKGPRFSLFQFWGILNKEDSGYTYIRLKHIISL